MFFLNSTNKPKTASEVRGKASFQRASRFFCVCSTQRREACSPGFRSRTPNARPGSVLYKHTARCPSFSGAEKSCLQNHPNVLGEVCRDGAEPLAPGALPAQLRGTQGHTRSELP